MPETANTKTTTQGEAAKYLALPYARIVIPEPDGSYRGEILEFPGCISSGDTATEALSALEATAESWLLAKLERNQRIPEPIENAADFSGKLVLRLPKSLHKKAAWIAEREGVSLNQFIVASLAVAVGEQQQSKTKPQEAVSLFEVGHSVVSNDFRNLWFDFQPVDFKSLTVMPSQSSWPRFRMTEDVKLLDNVIPLERKNA